MNKTLLYYWLALAKFSPRKINALIDTVGVERLWADMKQNSSSSVYDVKSKSFSLLMRNRDEAYLEDSFANCQKHGITFISRDDDAFPDILRQKEVSPPVGLFCRGNIDLLKTFCVAVIGTRNCTGYGSYATEFISGGLAKNNVTIVSGLATGIDGLAHDAALKACGSTIAVLGSGHDNFTPVTNIALYKRVVNSGLVVSEYPPDTQGAKHTFPERNRIISGLSHAVVVVESDARGGSMITASCALEQGRDVFAVPGAINQSRSRGTNALIKNGAYMVTCPDDIIDHYGLKKSVSERAAVSLDIYSQMVYNCLESGQKTFDEIVEATNMTATEISGALLFLEMEDYIRKINANAYMRVD